MAQDIIVGLIVAAAVLYVAWRYLPRRWRSRLGTVHPALAGPAGCGGCDSCGSGDGGSSAGGCSTPRAAAGGGAQPMVFHPPAQGAAQGAGAAKSRAAGNGEGSGGA
ncbi:hypothetical protein [Acidovorax sp. PRC11]|uniref:hypothetical protein n=1 Tax=Acidovorax sp. PRC11 TaxID=2962592 RepID=UPI002882293C|nr:hypothetical protein [Acidovorax sp. PRC11]MDT0139224.1 hypothetical protein [Acidovorax sp. PRC11]